MPEAARGVFVGARLGLIEQYVDLLATEGTLRGLIGPREVPRLWDRHILNCVALQEAVPPASTVCDVGSGAGLPGLVLAIARPDVAVTLLEPLLRRTTFLEECVDRLGLDNVRVVRGRADSLHGQATFDVVTSRAVAPLERLLEWSMPLVAPTGALVAMKGSSARAEVDETKEALRRWGTGPVEVLELGTALVDPPTLVVRVAWGDPAAISWPTARGGTGAAAAATRRPSRSNKPPRSSRQQRRSRD